MIKIKNIYYMLSYAYQNLSSQSEEWYSKEEFDYASDLFASILLKGTTHQIKQGINRDYQNIEESVTSPRGKVLLSETFNNMAKLDRKLICLADEYIEDTLINRILKSVFLLLLKSDEVKPANKKQIKRVLMLFSEVSYVDLCHVNWKNIHYNRFTKSYETLINVCRFIVDGMLVSEENGDIKLQKYVDDSKMYALYERFVAEYYKKHFSELAKAQTYIDWNVSESNDALLPVMRADIKLEKEGKALIIDTKYYNESLQKSNYGRETLHSSNLYQIYSYVKNYDVDHTGKVSGVLLYAQTNENGLCEDYEMDGNRICIRTLDLNADFDIIKSQLNSIVENWQA